MSVTKEWEIQYQTFRDSVFEAITNKSALATSQSRTARRKHRRKSSIKERALPSTPAAPSSTASLVDAVLDDPSSLADFSDYLASEIFISLPAFLRSLTHQANPSNLEVYSLPLSASVVEDIVSHLTPSITDTLTAYSLISPPQSETANFLTPVLTSYISAQTTPPPPPSTTRPHDNTCELCSRDHLPLTYHHLIPRSTHARSIKRGWHEESELNNVAWLCRACHSFVHRIASNEELAREWYTMGRLREREEADGWVKWVGGVRWKKR